MVRYFADVPSRAAALLIDAVLLAPATFVSALVVSALFGPAVAFNSSDGAGTGVSVDRGVATADAVVSVVLSVAYFVATWLVLAGSPGQRLLRMRIVRATDGARLALGQALIRWALLLGPAAVAGICTAATHGATEAFANLLALAWYVVLFVSTAASHTKQGVHDRVAKTVVSRTAKKWPQADEERARVH